MPWRLSMVTNISCAKQPWFLAGSAIQTYDLSLLARVKGGEFLSWEHATCLILYFSPPWPLTARGRRSFRGTVAPMFWCPSGSGDPRSSLAASIVLYAVESELAELNFF